VAIGHMFCDNRAYPTGLGAMLFNDLLLAALIMDPDDCAREQDWMMEPWADHPAGNEAYYLLFHSGWRDYAAYLARGPRTFADYRAAWMPAAAADPEAESAPASAPGAPP
jgi:hypothetical protein